MVKSPKLAPGTVYTYADQLREYERLMGPEAARRQIRLARLERKQCTCEPRKVKRKWEGSEKLTTRSVHERDCPKWKQWMDLGDAPSAAKSWTT